MVSVQAGRRTESLVLGGAKIKMSGELGGCSFVRLERDNL